MPTFKLIIGLEINFKNWQKAQNIMIYKVKRLCIPPPGVFCVIVKMFTNIDYPK